MQKNHIIIWCGLGVVHVADPFSFDTDLEPGIHFVETDPDTDSDPT